MANVQIPYQLFADLVRWHLLDVRDDDAAARISAGIEIKLDALARRSAYTASLTADTPEERAAARQRYLDSLRAT